MFCGYFDTPSIAPSHTNINHHPPHRLSSGLINHFHTPVGVRQSRAMRYQVADITRSTTQDIHPGTPGLCGPYSKDLLH
jgi:hypothetical protein